MDSATAWTIIGTLATVIVSLAGTVVALAKAYVHARDKRDQLESAIRESVVPVMVTVEGSLQGLSHAVQANTEVLRQSSDHELKNMAILIELQKTIDRTERKVEGCGGRLKGEADVQD